MLRVFNFNGSGASSDHGGSFTKIPLSTSIVVVTRKKIKSKKAISAIELALISVAVLLLELFLAMVDNYLKKFLSSPKTKITVAAIHNPTVVVIAPPTNLLIPSVILKSSAHFWVTFPSAIL